MQNLQVLTQEQAQHFIEKGYVTVKGCLDPVLAKAWTDEAYGRLGYDPNDRSTWTKDIVWMDRNHVAPIKEISPKAWGGAVRRRRRRGPHRDQGHGDRVAALYDHQLDRVV